MREVIPIITGDVTIPNESDLPFTNLESVTDETTVKAVPDYFQGIRPSGIDKKVRHDLNNTIIPTKHANAPALPNFFLEVKGPNGEAHAQVCYDGAHGARAMHALQNYGEIEPIYDGNAYTYSTTYHTATGTLQLYAHHLTAPAATGGRPHYYMTQLKSYALTCDRETFVQGATALRNLMDLAKRHRDLFFQAANAKGSQRASHIAKSSK